ncbi:isochorismatase [Streptomyces sp. CB01249]|uniref:phosphopantetheine-binding protein n=1 Tax=unclassified Streptomyces TaxID=2593676 RepID=UPI00093CC155|nr:phosphopantetheine-binding protein [Streptomyces sp. CB01249]OKI91978.1 isochorismatase [Streptomyces sp. CB01249]
MSRTTTAPTADEIRQAVAELVGFHARDIADDANLIALGLKSLHIMQLVNVWRRAGLTVSFKELADEPTVAAWAGKFS